MDDVHSVATHNENPPFFVPDPEKAAASQLAAFMRFCEEETGEPFPDCAAFHRFSVEDHPRFWGLFLRWSGIRCEGESIPVCTDSLCERARFFPNLHLSYVENLLCGEPSDDDQIALTVRRASGAREHLSRADLRDRVLRLAGALVALGIGPGDRAVAVAYNNSEIILAALAAAAVGATVSSAAPDMGAPSILSRFQQLEPAILFANLSVPAGGGPLSLPERIAEVARELPSLTSFVALDDGPLPPDLAVPAHRLSDLLRHAPLAGSLPRFPFNHPLFILFSSGTTGKPKCIVHGAGGTLLEHVKEHRLHGDLRAADTMLFHTSAAWMMWNWQMSALACGARIVVYDGPVCGAETLWRIVAEEKVTVFGTSPPYLQLCQDAGYAPGRALDLTALRAILSTGSILYDRQYDWVREHVGALPVQSISGGTDIIGCFVLGNPMLPVYRGESQGRSLGLDVQALRGDGSPASERIGELVCRNPFPSRPLGFHGDPDGERFHRAYFSQNPGVWTHGDLIEFSPQGSARLHGRSDGVLNVNGFRIGPAEIYRILQAIPDIAEAMAVEQRVPGAGSETRLVLLVVLKTPGGFDRDLAIRIRRTLARDGSAAHVPAVIAEVRELPVTHSGKRSECAARDALNGLDAGNAGALRNPDCLEHIRRQVEQSLPAPTYTEDAQAMDGDSFVDRELRAVWESLLGVSPIRAEDDFFELGGSSLLAVHLLMEVRDRLGVELPPSILLRAPTLGALSAVLRAGADEPFAPPVLLRAGHGQDHGQEHERPVFLVHGLRGDVLDLRPLAARLDLGRPVYGLQARGLDARERPQDRVEDMAAYYVEHVRRLQPEGPYALAGFSFGGLVAYEMACRLRREGEEVEFLGLIDSYVDAGCLLSTERLRFLTARPARVAWRKVRRLLGAAPPERLAEPTLPLLQQQARESRRAQSAYRPQPYGGPVTFFRATGRNPWYCDPLPVWRRAAVAGLTVLQVPGGHLDLIREPNVAVLARLLCDGLRPKSLTIPQHVDGASEAAAAQMPDQAMPDPDAPGLSCATQP